MRSVRSGTTKLGIRAANWLEIMTSRDAKVLVFKRLSFFVAKIGPKKITSRDGFSEKRTGNIAKRRFLANPYGPEIQTEFCYFPGEDDPNSEKGGIYESPPDRYVPNSSPANGCVLLKKVHKTAVVAQGPSAEMCVGDFCVV